MTNILQNIRHKKWIAVALVVVVLTVAGAIAFGGSSSEQAEAATPDEQAASDSSAQTSVAKGGLASYDINGDGIVYQDGMHPWYVQDEPGTAPDCGMDLTPVSVTGMEEGTVKVDPVTLQNIGVRTAPVITVPLAREVRSTGRFVMDEQGEHTVSLKISGWIEKLYANYDGARIRKGQPLLELYSPELVSTQEEYLLALRNVARLEGSDAAGDARRLMEAARRRLAYWDLSEDQIQGLEETGEPHRTLTFYAPSSGEVMRRQVSEGEYVEAGQTLMDIVDISKNWLIVDVYEQDLAWVNVGTPARIELPYNPGVTYTGRVDYIYHMLDMQTRAAKARIVMPGGHNAPIKPGMYATVHLMGKEAAPAPVVPEEALIRTGDEAVVIVALGEGRFRPIQVKPGIASEGRVQILEGLQGDEEVVTSAQFLIDSEARLQSAIGAMTSMDMGADMQGHEGEGAPAASEMQSGVQVVRITVGASGFEPQKLELKAGVPARLLFTRTTDGTCAKQVQIPEFGIGKTDLPLGEPVAIEFTPEKTGPFTFACGMDMLKGSLIVTPAG